MERAIEAFLCVLGEDFDKNTKIMEDDRYVEAINHNKDMISRVQKALEPQFGKEVASELLEELGNSFYSLMIIREQHAFKQSFLLGVNIGIDVEKAKPNYPFIED